MSTAATCGRAWPAEHHGPQAAPLNGSCITLLRINKVTLLQSVGCNELHRPESASRTPCPRSSVLVGWLVWESLNAPAWAAHEPDRQPGLGLALHPAWVVGHVAPHRDAPWRCTSGGASVEPTRSCMDPRRCFLRAWPRRPITAGAAAGYPAAAAALLNAVAHRPQPHLQPPPT